MENTAKIKTRNTKAPAIKLIKSNTRFFSKLHTMLVQSSPLPLLKTEAKIVNGTECKVQFALLNFTRHYQHWNKILHCELYIHNTSILAI